MKNSIYYSSRRCPICGKRLVERQNRTSNQFFIGCSGYPKCKFTRHKDAVDFACEAMGVDWRPIFSNSALKVLEKCQSRDEKEYLIGAAYYLDNHDEDYEADHMEIDASTISYKSKNYQTIVFIDPYKYYSGSSIPSTLAFVPQFDFGKSFHHDFMIFYSSYRFGSNADWKIGPAVEVDVHPYHDFCKSQDKYRDFISPHYVLRLHPNTDKPLTWFSKVLTLWNTKTY